MRGKHVGTLERTPARATVSVNGKRVGCPESQPGENCLWTWRSPETSGQKQSSFQENGSSLRAASLDLCLLCALVHLHHHLAPCGCSGKTLRECKERRREYLGPGSEQMRPALKPG